MKRREILKSGGGALAALLGGVAVASAAPTAASDREKVEAVEDLFAKRDRACELGQRASSIASPIADRAFKAAEGEAKRMGLGGSEAAALAGDAHERAWIEAYAPYRQEVDAAWDSVMVARDRVSRLFDVEHVF